MKVRVAAGIGLLGVLLVSSGCCSTWVALRAMRGSGGPMHSAIPERDVWICPGEDVTLGWATSDDVSEATVTDLGSVSVPSGFKTIENIQETKTYTLKGKGECERTASVVVTVIEDGTERHISADRWYQYSPEQGESFIFGYEKEISALFTSPSIHATSIKLDSSIPTVAGWYVKKTDTDGTVHDFNIGNAWESPWGTTEELRPPLVGKWELAPINPSELGPPSSPGDLPTHVTFSVRMVCQ